MATLELISHPTCPFVHRAAALLTEIGVPFTQRHVDLEAKPDWFLAISPRGKVPLLVVDGTPIFESAVILEYLAEVYAPQIIPAEPLARARMRMWAEITDDLMTAHYKATIAPAAQADRDAALDQLRATLARFEPEIAGTFFAGEQPGLVDFAAGPALLRLEKLRGLLGIDLYAHVPRVAAWARAIAARPSFTAPLVADFDERYAQQLRRFDAAA